MGQAKKILAILNLTGELLPELSEYFSSRNVLVIDPLKDDTIHEWTHIITKNVQNFNLINSTYSAVENEINLISLSKVDDLQNFTLNNGNVVLDDIWFKGPMGAFIMDKYFQGYGGINLSDNYPTFKETGSFKIANPFSTGEYVDQLVQKAFESEVEALSVKSFFDHLVMYLAGLKNSGKAGLPFEVTYGSFEEVFAVQIHFFSQGLSLQDVAGSLSSTLSKKAEEYLLNVAVQSSDFFDFSFMPELNKVMVTALWTTDKRIKFENRGLMFSALSGGVALTQYSSHEVSSSLISAHLLNDYSEKVQLTKVSDDAFPSDPPRTITGQEFDVDSTETVVSGSRPEDESSTVVKGSKDLTSDEAALIKGESALEELVQTVRGKFEKEDKSTIKLAGSKLDVDKFAYTVASNIDETTKEKNLKVRSLGNKLPESIKTGLFDFAKGLNKDVEDLDDQELDLFQLKKIPEILTSELQSQAKIAVATEKEKTTEIRLKSLNNALTKDLSANPEVVKQLEARLATVNSENEKLKSQMKTLGSEVRILKESRNKLAEIQMKASQASSETHVKSNEEDDKIRQHFLEKLNDQKTLNDQDLKKLSAILEKGSKMASDFRQVEMKARKLELEALQKETLFTSELEKSERQIKAKDLVLIKTKETFTKLVEKKDREISDLTLKADQLLKNISSSANSSQIQTIKDLEKQNLNLNKQLEVYKTKMTSLATNLQPSKADENFKDEARKLQMLNQQMKNQLDVSKKEIEKLQTKVSSDSSLLLALRQEKIKLEADLKKRALEAKVQVSQPSTHEQELKKLQAQNQILETQVKDSTYKILNLETKLIEASRPQKSTAAPEDNSKVKVNQLENSLKKLTQDLVQARNQLGEEKKETNKLRQDKTALQNQLDKLKKDADKAKPATPKKPGGKAA